MYFSWSWSWGLLVLWTIVLGIWAGTGWKKIDIGWRGQLLFLGGRMTGFFNEGWRWAPFPFGIKPADCRKQTLDLKVLEATTIDNVKVFVGGSVVYRVVDLDIYFNAEKQDLENWVDNTRKQVIRTRVRELPQAEVLNMHDDLGKEMETALRNQGSDQWGVEIIQVIMPEIFPDPEVAKDLALLERENLQQKGQRVQARHQADLVKFFSGTEKLGDEGPTGPGLSPELAYEASLIHIDKAEKKKLASNTLGLDVATVKALVEAVTGRK
jgi:regulator of protease activity HflC (stomatin/prohibitin superfamily)